MSYYELRKKLIALSKLLTRARMEQRSRAVVERIRAMIDATEEQIADCDY